MRKTSFALVEALNRSFNDVEELNCVIYSIALHEFANSRPIRLCIAFTAQLNLEILGIETVDCDVP